MPLIKKLPADSDLVGVDKTIKRAAKSAHILARKTKTPCYVDKEGKLLNITEKAPSATAIDV